MLFWIPFHHWGYGISGFHVHDSVKWLNISKCPSSLDARDIWSSLIPIPLCNSNEIWRWMSHRLIFQLSENMTESYTLLLCLWSGLFLCKNPLDHGMFVADMNTCIWIICYSTNIKETASSHIFNVTCVTKVETDVITVQNNYHTSGVLKIYYKT